MTLIPELRADLHAAATRPGHRLDHRWTRHLRPKLFMATGGLTLVGAIVALILVLSASPATSPAYAMTANPDGSYTVQLFNLTKGIPALNAKFASLGIDETVIPVTSDCPYKGLFGYSSVSASQTVRFSPGRKYVSPGYTGYAAAVSIGNGRVAMALGAMRPPLPTCLSADSPAAAAHMPLRRFAPTRPLHR